MFPKTKGSTPPQVGVLHPRRVPSELCFEPLNMAKSRCWAHNQTDVRFGDGKVTPKMWLTCAREGPVSGLPWPNCPMCTLLATEVRGPPGGAAPFWVCLGCLRPASARYGPKGMCSGQFEPYSGHRVERTVRLGPKRRGVDGLTHTYHLGFEPSGASNSR